MFEVKHENTCEIVVLNVFEILEAAIAEAKLLVKGYEKFYGDPETDTCDSFRITVSEAIPAGTDMDDPEFVFPEDLYDTGWYVAD